MIPTDSLPSLLRWAIGAALLVALSACGSREDPARVELRARLKQDATLSADELARVLDEVSRSLAGKTVRIRQGAATEELDDGQKDVVLGMLTNRAGVYDEGLRTDGGLDRVINAPGRSSNAEIEATRRLFVDVETFLPRRFEFSHAFAGLGDYAFDLAVE